MSPRNVTPPWASWPACPCGCGKEGSKLQSRNDRHLIGCSCRPCLGRRNRSKGQKAQAKGHRALGGVGMTPSNEESVGGYPITVQVEWKTGKQVPASFAKFLATDWFRRALSQAKRAQRIGDNSKPAVGVDGKWLVVDISQPPSKEDR